MMMRWLAACGIVAPVADILITVGLGTLDPGYSHLRQYISELGEVGRPYAASFNTWSVAYGLLFAGFAIGLGPDLGSRAVQAALAGGICSNPTIIAVASHAPPAAGVINSKPA